MINLKQAYQKLSSRYRYQPFCTAILACTLFNTPHLAAQQSDTEIHLLPVQGNVHMLHAGEAGNIAVQVGADGILLVNALRAGLTDAITDALQTLSPAPIRYIINTSGGLHITGGNADLAARGMFGATPALGPGDNPGATLVAHENILFRLSLLAAQPGSGFSEHGVPRNVYYGAYKDIFFNGEPVFIMHEDSAHSNGDSIVLFRRSDVIAVGDLFHIGEYPIIDVSNGGSAQGLINALNHVLDLAVPERLQEGGTRIIPGRGRLANEADLVEYRNMVVIIRDRVRYLMQAGLDLDEILAAHPTLDYDPEFNGHAAGEVFVTSIYESLLAES